MLNAASSNPTSEPRPRFDSDAGQQVQLFAGRLRLRRPGSLWSRALCLGMVLVAVRLPCSLSAQQHDAPVSAAGLPGSASSAANPAGTQDPLSHHVEEHMAERRNSERQKTLVADTDRLLLLAQQLKADVDKSNKDMLSVDVVKRAEQIEKLARSVKEKMRGN